MAETPATDLAPTWRGEWAYQQTMKEADPAPSDPVFLYSGGLSIYDCKNNHCSFVLDYGNQSSICDLDGSVVLKSKFLATYSNPKSDNAGECRANLILKDGKIDVSSESEGCSDYCGHAGTNFGSDYKRWGWPR